MYKLSKKVFLKFIKSNDIVVKKQGLFFKYNNGLIEMTWNNVKKYPKMLLRFNKFRKEYVDTLLNEIIEFVKCKPDCYKIAAGSTSLDSDYDITIYGNNSSRIIELFHDKFLSKFRKESSIVFDTNIYGTSFFHTSFTNNYDYAIKNKNKKCTPDNFIYYINIHNKDDTIKQHVWGFIKLFLYLNKILDINLREFIYTYITDVLNSKLGIIKRSISLLNDLGNMKSSYTKELRKYDIIKRKFEIDPKKNIKLASQLKDQISRTNFYGNETYFTQGAVNHVVGHLQLKYEDLLVSKHEYIDSLLENLGDVIKEYNIYYNRYDLFAIYSSKYIIRVADASIHLNPRNTFIHKKLKSIGEDLRHSRDTKVSNDIQRQLKVLQKVLGYTNQNSEDLLISLVYYTFMTIKKHFTEYH